MHSVFITSTLGVPLFSSLLCFLQFTQRKLIKPFPDSNHAIAKSLLVFFVSARIIYPSNFIGKKLLSSTKVSSRLPIIPSIGWSCINLTLLRGEVFSAILKPCQPYFLLLTVITL